MPEGIPMTIESIQTEKEWRKYHTNTYTPLVHDGIFTFMDCPDRQSHFTNIDFDTCENLWAVRETGFGCKWKCEMGTCPRGYRR